jgi:hypothetical protein
MTVYKRKEESVMRNIEKKRSQLSLALIIEEVRLDRMPEKIQEAVLELLSQLILNHLKYGKSPKALPVKEGNNGK